MRFGLITVCGVFGLLFLSCKTDNIRQNTRDLSLVQTSDDAGGTDDMDVSSDEDMAMMSLPPDFAGVEAGMLMIDLAIDRDASGCAPGQTGTACPNAIDPQAGCMAVEDCIADPMGSPKGNGLDDDCNGKVDDGCTCTPGEVQRCFMGPPGKHNKGACTDGQMTCIGSLEFGSWGDCEGSISPSAEVCDGLDNDCNDCADDELCCGGGGVICPGPTSPFITPVAPFATKMYTGTDFFPTASAGTTFTWKVEGGPCDKLFASSGFTPLQNPPKQSFTVTGGNTANPSIRFTLSGDYTVTMTVVDMGKTYQCRWIQKVIAPGVRVELCWDHMGTAAQGGADLDLHVHRYVPSLLVQQPWIGTVQGRNFSSISNDDCFFANCTGPGYSLNWGLPRSPLSACNGSPNGSSWPAAGCGNPRLDIDNIFEIAVPENTNIDNPANNARFRVMAHYWGQGNGTANVSNPVDSPTGTLYPANAPVVEHPIVNIYCGGQLRASFGQAPNQVNSTTAAVNFDRRQCSNKQCTQLPIGQFWRVADLVAQVDGSGNTTGCMVTPLRDPANNAKQYWVTPHTNDSFAY